MMEYDLANITWKQETKTMPLYGAGEMHGNFVIFKGELYWVGKNPMQDGTPERGYGYLYKKQASGDWILIDEFKNSIDNLSYLYYPCATKDKIFLYRYRDCFSWDETNGFQMMYANDRIAWSNIDTFVPYKDKVYGLMSKHSGYCSLAKLDLNTGRFQDLYYTNSIPSICFGAYLKDDILYAFGEEYNGRFLYKLPLKRGTDGEFNSQKSTMERLEMRYSTRKILFYGNKGLLYDGNDKIWVQCNLDTMTKTTRSMPDTQESGAYPVVDNIVYDQKFWVVYGKRLLTYDLTSARYEENETNIVTTSFLGKAFLYLLRKLDAVKQDRLTFDAKPTKGSKNPVTSDGIAQEFEKQKLVFDSVPTEGSKNPVTSGGIFSAFKQKQNVLTFDQAPTKNSQNPVTSDGVLMAIQTAVPNLESGYGIVVKKTENTLVVSVERGAFSSAIVLHDISITPDDWTSSCTFRIECDAISSNSKCIIRIYYDSSSVKTLKRYTMNYTQRTGYVQLQIDRKPNFTIVVQTLEIVTGSDENSLSDESV